MWEDTLIESRGSAEGSKRWWTVPLSFVMHILIIGIILGASYWFVEAVAPPAIPVTLFSAPPPPPPPPPAAKPKPKEVKPVEKVVPTREVQPTEVPEQLPTPEDIKPQDAGVDGGVDGGVEGGVEGGVAGGVLGGVSGGALGGQLGGDETPMRITAEVKQPVLIKKVDPQYPEIARRARIQGIVILEAVITKTGTVEDVRVLRSLHPILDQSAISAVKQWKYQPAMLNDRPVKVYFTVTVNFTLK